VLSGDLDEYTIDGLADAPADSYGVGTRVVTGSGHPTVSFVYKLVVREDDGGAMVGVAKTSAAKATQAGRKTAWRRLADGIATAEVLRLDDRDEPGARRLQVPLVTGGKAVAADDLDAARERHRRAMAELPRPAFRLSDGPPCIPTEGPS
jgi:nicotinate phosphoribosyltransferase